MRRFLLLTLAACTTPATSTVEAPPLDLSPRLEPLAEPEKPDEKQWDLEKMPGKKKQVALDLDEGTWMSLDVSPDGKQIVFDLLGDIYVMPAAGGDARPITRGAKRNRSATRVDGGSCVSSRPVRRRPVWPAGLS